MPKCEICECTIQHGRYCQGCARLQKDEGLPGHSMPEPPNSGLTLDDLELARDDYEYQAKHADDVQERNFFQRQADQLAEGIESMQEVEADV